jgi:RNA polymerase sigma-70 factor (ECF subfamily)
MPGPTDDWASWLDRHGPALVLLARAWVSTRADAEDVVQEAFVRFWRSRDRAADPTAYLFTCVKRCALDWVRTRGRQARREAAVAKPEGEPLFDGPLEQAERRAAVAAALDTLPEVQREVLVMKVWGGLTFPQIATALGIPADTAASRFRYALSKLRERLAEESIP